MGTFSFPAGAKIRASDMNHIEWNTFLGQATGADPTVSAVATDVVSGTVTFTTPVINTVVIARAVFDVTANGATDIFVGSLLVDGALQGQQAIQQLTGRGNTAQQWRVTLSTAASHTLKLQQQKIGATNVLTMFVAHTSLIVGGLGIV